MDFDRLAEFAVISRLGSIKKAAQELGVSTATLSARLKRFEEHLGAPLFIRKVDVVSLTPAGEQLLPIATELLINYQRIHTEMLTAQEHSYRHLRIAVSGFELPMYLGPFLDKLNLNNPHIQLDILDDCTYGIAEGVLSGAVDLYFSPVMREFSSPALTKMQISSANHYVVLPRNHRLADRPMVSIRELDQETFILYPRTAESSIRDFQLLNLQDSGICYSLYDSDTSVVFHSLQVPIGKGVILHPVHIMALPPNSVCIPVTDLPHQASICYFYNKSNPNPDVQAFVRDFPKFAKEVNRREHRQTL